MTLFFILHCYVLYNLQLPSDHETRPLFSHFGRYRFNAALATPQYRSGTADFFLPGKFSERFTLPTEKSLNFAFRCPFYNNLRLNVKWVGFYAHEQSKPFTSAESYFINNCIKDPSDLFGDEDENDGQGGDRSKLEKQEDPEKKDISDLKSSLRELLMQSASPPASNPTDSKLDHPLFAFPPQVLHSPTRDGPATSPEEDLSKHVDEIVSKLDMLSSERLPVVKFYDDYGGRVSEMSRAMGALPFKEVYQGKHGISACTWTFLTGRLFSLFYSLLISLLSIHASDAERRQNGCDYSSD